MNEGTDSLLLLADELEQSVEHVRGGYHLRQAAERIERAAKAIRRLAPLEPDLQVEQGEN